jgi:hypothetical protein
MADGAPLPPMTIAGVGGSLPRYVTTFGYFGKRNAGSCWSRSRLFIFVFALRMLRILSIVSVISHCVYCSIALLTNSPIPSWNQAHRVFEHLRAGLQITSRRRPCLSSYATQPINIRHDDVIFCHPLIIDFIIPVCSMKACVGCPIWTATPSHKPMPSELGGMLHQHSIL